MSLQVKPLNRPGYTLHPVPIKKEDYLRTLKAVGLPGTDEYRETMERIRLHEIYETFNGWFNPVGFQGKELVWEVRFPAASKWKSGPPAMGGPLNAMQENYKRNKYFPGFMEDKRMDPLTFLQADKRADEKLQSERTHREETVHEDALRQQGGLLGMPVHPGRPESD